MYNISDITLWGLEGMEPVWTEQLLLEVDRTKQNIVIMGYRQYSQDTEYPKIEEREVRKGIEIYVEGSTWKNGYTADKLSWFYILLRLGNAPNMEKCPNYWFR